MKRFWLPQLVCGSIFLWSGMVLAQSGWEQPAGTGTPPANRQPNGYTVPVPTSAAHLYGYSQAPQPPAADTSEANGPAQTGPLQSVRYPLPTELPSPVVPPAGMSATTSAAGGFAVVPSDSRQSFPVSYRQDLIVPSQPGEQAEPGRAPAYQPGNPLPSEWSANPAGVQAVPGSPAAFEQSGYAAPSGVGCDAGCGPAGCDTESNCLPAGNEGRLASRLGKFFCGGDANWVVGVNALIFARDYEDDKGLSYNSGGDYLFSTDADLETFAGAETVISRRNCSGSGWEVRYWGLYPGSTSNMIDSMPGTALTGLQNLYYAPAMASVLDVYNAADRHRVTRDNDFSNLEFNLLRNGGSFTGWGCRNAYYELLGGFRWFQFDEAFTYSAINSTMPWPSQLDYAIDVQNTLLGFQLGGRTEWCLTNKLRLVTGLRGGIFNNRISHTSRIADSWGNEATIQGGPYNGAMYDYESTKDDLAFLGELDAGLAYQVSCRLRLNFGYRLLGVSGVALAPDQFPYNFTDSADIQRIDSNGSLLLHGGYAGAQFCF